MKILMFGRGVIATQYGWALDKAGNTVEFYVRPGRAAQYGPTVNLEIRDGRLSLKGTLIRENWPITMREELTSEHDYDLIILSVNHNQFSEAANFLSHRIGKATVLIFNNLWDDPETEISMFPKNQVVWGFPGGGGGFDSSTLKGGFMKLIYMGTLDGAERTARYQEVYKLFRDAGFSISEQKDFRSWLWFHFVLNAGLAAQALKIGGYSKLIGSPENLAQSFKLIAEMLPLLKAKGDKPKLSAILLLKLPSALVGFIISKVISKDSLPGYLMEQLETSGHSSYELTSLYPQDVLSEARRLGVSLPLLTALEPVFKKK